MIFKNEERFSPTKTMLDKIKEKFPSGLAEIRYEGLKVNRLTEKGKTIETKPRTISISAVVSVVDDKGNIAEYRYSPSNPTVDRNGRKYFPTKVFFMSDFTKLDLSDPDQLDKVIFLYFFSNQVTNGQNDKLNVGVPHVYFYDEEEEATGELKKLEISTRYQAMLINTDAKEYIDDKNLLVYVRGIAGANEYTSLTKTRLELYKSLLANQRMREDFEKIYQDPTTKEEKQVVGIVGQLIAQNILFLTEEGVQYLNEKEEKTVLVPSIKEFNETTIGKIAGNLSTPARQALFEKLKAKLA